MPVRKKAERGKQDTHIPACEAAKPCLLQLHGRPGSPSFWCPNATAAHLISVSSMQVRCRPPSMPLQHLPKNDALLGEGSPPHASKDRAPRMRTCTHVDACHTHPHVHTHTHMCLYIYIYVCIIYAHTQKLCITYVIYIYIYMYTGTLTHIYIYIHTCLQMHAYTDRYTQLRPAWLPPWPRQRSEPRPRTGPPTPQDCLRAGSEC